MPITFKTAVQIETYLVEQGLEKLSTGGGLSGWFLRNIGGNADWQIFITGPEDTAALDPGKPVYIALEASGGVQCEHEDLDNPDTLPDAIARLHKIALDKQRHLG